MIANRLFAIRSSLLARLLIVLFLVAASGAVVLFFAIDHFISRQFDRLHEEQTVYTAERVRHLVDEEGKRLLGLAELLAKDADLNHSTFYHLFLAGERDHPQASVARIFEAFDFESVSLWDSEGRPIAAMPGPVSTAAPALPGLSPGSRLIRQGANVWLVAEAPLLREGRPIAVLRVSRPLDRVLASALPTLYPASLKIPSGSSSPGATPIQLGNQAGQAAATLELELPNTAGAALGEVKALLVTLLGGAGVALALLVGFFLRRELRPLATLSSLAAAVGRGDFRQRAAVDGSSEISQLAEAFNGMASGLEKLRELERRFAHQEQLSAIGRVAARVAHDINNPLTVIANTARLALRNPPPDRELAEDLRRIVHHGERCIRTVELLLDYGRPVRLSPVTLELCPFLQRIGERWGVLVDCRGKTAVQGDPLQLEQLFDNLLTNARQAAGELGEIGLSVQMEGETVRITVTDSGPGLTDEARMHFCEPFFTTKPGGTGLGMASALAVARAHGGDLEAPEGTGGKITVILPAANQARENMAPPR